MTVLINGVLYQPVPLPPDDETHSPLPWSVKDDDLIDADGKWIKSPRFAMSSWEWPANRSLILRAVNHYQKILKFLDRVSRYQDSHDTAYTISTAARDLLLQIRETPTEGKPCRKPSV